MKKDEPEKKIEPKGSSLKKSCQQRLIQCVSVHSGFEMHIKLYLSWILGMTLCLVLIVPKFVIVCC